MRRPDDLAAAPNRARYIDGSGRLPFTGPVSARPLAIARNACYTTKAFGDVAQLGERDNRTVEVRGSSPLISTDSPLTML